MIEKLGKKILDIISTEQDSETKKEIMLFGITRIVEDVPKYIGILIICYFLGIVKELGIVLLITACYKTFTGGVHMKTNIGCFIGSVAYFLTCIYLPKLVGFSVEYAEYRAIFYVLMYIFGIYVILIYVPADVPEVPIINEKRRKRDKICAFVVLNLIYIVAAIFVKNIVIKDMIIMTMFYINIMTTRVVYKIFKNEYGYETYVPDELIIVE